VCFLWCFHRDCHVCICVGSAAPLRISVAYFPHVLRARSKSTYSSVTFKSVQQQSAISLPTLRCRPAYKVVIEVYRFKNRYFALIYVASFVKKCTYSRFRLMSLFHDAPVVLFPALSRNRVNNLLPIYIKVK
jgi:hypothetical protein